MDKDWRITICARYRALIVVVLVLGVWTLSIFLGSAIQRNQREAWDAKLANVKVGTARARLVKILGEPQRTERIGSDQGLWLRESSSEESEKIKSKHKVLVVALVWLLFRTWCARQIRKSRAVSGSDRVPEK